MKSICGCVLALAALVFTAGCQRNAASHVKRADQYSAEKKYSEAILEYRSALQQDPQLGYVRLRLADLYAEVGDVQNAYKEYIRAGDALPNDANAQLKAGAMMLMTKRFAEAKTRAESALQLSPKNPGALMLLGNALAGMNDMQGALDQMGEAILADPTSGAAYSNLATIQLARGDQQLAEASFKKAINVNPKSPGAYVALANFYRAQKRLPDAERTLKEALAAEPRNAQINSNLAELYMRTGREREAEGPLKMMVEAMHDARAQLTLAEYYIRTNRSGMAVPILQKLAADRNTYGVAAARLAALEYSEGRAADAHKILDEVLKREPTNRNALLLSAQVLAMEKKYDEALTYVRAAGAADPARIAEPTLVAAKIYTAKGQLEEARDAFKQVLAIEPRSVTALLALSRLHASTGESKMALEYAQSAVEGAPDNVEAHLVLIAALTAKGEVVDAEREVRFLRDALQPNAPVEVAAGELYLRRRDPAAARQAFTKALTLNPASAEALGGLTELDLTASDVPAAVARIETRLHDAPDDGHAWFLAAQAYFAGRDPLKSEAALKKTIELDPANLRAFALLGGFYAARGKTEEATREFKTWTARQPRSIPAHTMLGLLLEQQGDKAEAKKVFEHTLEIDPNAAIAANNLAWMYADAGDNLDLALQLAQSASGQAPDVPSFNDTLGWVYYRKDLPSQAVPLLQRAIEQDPKNAVYHYHLGMVYAKQGEDIRAGASLKRALSLDPNFAGAPDAKKALSELILQ